MQGQPRPWWNKWLAGSDEMKGLKRKKLTFCFSPSADDTLEVVPVPVWPARQADGRHLGGEPAP